MEENNDEISNEEIYTKTKLVVCCLCFSYTYYCCVYLPFSICYKD